MNKIHQIQQDIKILISHNQAGFIMNTRLVQYLEVNWVIHYVNSLRQGLANYSVWTQLSWPLFKGLRAPFEWAPFEWSISEVGRPTQGTVLHPGRPLYSQSLPPLLAVVPHHFPRPVLFTIYSVFNGLEPSSGITVRESVTKGGDLPPVSHPSRDGWVL